MLTVRPMESADIDQVYQIELSAHRAPWSKGILSDCVLVGYDCRVLEKAENNTKQLAGYIICRRSFNICHILNLCISPTFQNQGLGKFFLKNILDSLEGSIIKSIILEVRPSNKIAIALYEAFGFTHDSIKSGYYKDIAGEEDAILLKKNINQV